MRLLALLLALTIAPAMAAAQPRRARTPRATRVARAAPARAVVAQPTRDRFQGTFSVGATVGVGSPRGLAGAFVELRPWRFLGVSLGGGFGGAFGPAVDATVLLSPLGGRGWALGVEGSVSNQFSYVSGELIPGRPALPASTQWASLGAQVELRPSRGMLLRVGVGRAWLLNTGDFRVATTTELRNAELAQDSTLPGVGPVDAARAAAEGSTLGVWYLHLDVAPAWRW